MTDGKPLAEVVIVLACGMKCADVDGMDVRWGTDFLVDFVTLVGRVFFGWHVGRCLCLSC